MGQPPLQWPHVERELRLARKPPENAPAPKTPGFDASGGTDIRFESKGFVVPDSVPLSFDVPPDTSKPIDLTFRNIEQPSTKEYIVRLDITVRYDGSHRLEIPDVFFSSAAIGSYYPAYERNLICPERLAAHDRHIMSQIQALTGHKSPRVEFLEAELQTLGSN